jgi:hypothetical protein
MNKFRITVIHQNGKRIIRNRRSISSQELFVDTYLEFGKKVKIKVKQV